MKYMYYLLKTLKACLSVFLILIALMTISFSMEPKMDQDLPDDDKMLYGFINREGKRLGVKYHMRQSATGIGGMDKVWLMSLAFDRYGEPLTENEARKLIISCVDDFLEAVNKDEELKPYLKNYPLTAKNLELTIYNYDKNQVLHYFPYIAIVADSRGKIGFFTEDASVKYGYHTKKYETYEESVAILKKEEITDCSS
jgi:hypothetical protein